MKYLLLIIFVFICNVAIALDAIQPLKLPKHYELVSIGTDQNIWLRGKQIDQQQLIAAVLYLQTEESLEALVIAADSEVENSEFYKQLVGQLSERVRIVNLNDL
jgi:biopolymer transport protein ExbD